MTTQEIAEALVQYNRDLQFIEAYDTLFHPDATSDEMPDVPGGMVHLEGIEDIKKKGAAWEKDEEIHSVDGEILVAEDWFAVKWAMDTTFRATGERRTLEELSMYEVRDGKIVAERFFYHIPDTDA